MSVDIFDKYNIKLPSISDADKMENPPIVAYFTNGNWSWYVIAGEKIKDEDYLLYGLVDGMHKELGTFTLNQIEDVSATLIPNLDKISLYDLIEKIK